MQCLDLKNVWIILFQLITLEIRQAKIKIFRSLTPEYMLLFSRDQEGIFHLTYIFAQLAKFYYNVSSLSSKAQCQCWTQDKGINVPVG